MKKTIQILAIIFLVLIIALVLIFFANPFGLRTKIISGIINNYISSQMDNVSTGTSTDMSSTTPATGLQTATSSDKNLLLNPQQEQQLQNMGVNIDQLPKTITPGMESCFVAILGVQRVNEIINGSSPTTFEFFRVKDCLNK